MMITGPKGIALIKHSEGTEYTAYRDSIGVLTIGTGHTGPDVMEGMTITDDQATHLLMKDLAHAEETVSAYVRVPLSQDQFDALVSFVFNVGSGNFRSSTLLVKLNAGDYGGAGDQFRRWDKAAGKVLAGLVRRRAAERNLFLGEPWQ